MALALLFIGLVGVLGIRAIRGIEQAQEATSVASAVATAFASVSDGQLEDLDLLSSQIEGARLRLQKAESNLFPFSEIVPAISWLPNVGPRLSESKARFDLAVELVEGSSELIKALQLLSDAESGDFSISGDGGLFGLPSEVIDRAGQHFAAALEHIAEASSINDGRDGVTDLRTDVRLRGAMATGQDLAQAGSFITSNWSELLGYERPARYLIAAVNADELRAGGGFIPAFWEMEIVQGSPRSVRFIDSYDVELDPDAVPQAPIEMLRSMWAGGVFARDTAWYPDFSKNVEGLLDIFRIQRGGADYDAVIAVDQFGFSRIVSALPPITLESGIEITDLNLLEVLQVGTDSEAGRGFLSGVMDAVVDSVLKFDGASTLTALLLESFIATKERHIQVAFMDEGIQKQANLVPALASVTSEFDETDYLLVTDSNVGFSKVNRNIERSVEYTLDASDLDNIVSLVEVTHENVGRGEPSGQCQIQDSNTGGATYPDALVACFWNLFRVYVPTDAELLDWPRLDIPAGALYRQVGYNDTEDSFLEYEESGRRVYSGIFTLDIGEKREIRAVYGNPDAISVGDDGDLEYRLRIAHQPGLRAERVGVSLVLPDNYVVTRVDPLPSLIGGNSLRFELTGSQDVEIMIFARRDSGAVDIVNGYLGDASTELSAEQVLAEATAPVAVAGAERLGVLAELIVSPRTANLAPFSETRYFAFARDAFGNILSDVEIDWSLGESGAGTIDPEGFFIAGGDVGSFQDVVQAIGVQNSTGKQIPRTATVFIRRDPLPFLDRVTPFPGSLSVLPNQALPLRALAWSAQNALLASVDLEWSVIDGRAGKILAESQFSAGAAPGTFRDAIKVTARQVIGGIELTEEAYLDVTISEFAGGGATDVRLSPSNLTLRPGHQFRFGAVALDAEGRALPANWIWVVSDEDVATIDEDGRLTISDDAVVGGNVDVIAVLASRDPSLPPLRGVSVVTVASELSSGPIRVAARPSSVSLFAGDSRSLKPDIQLSRAEDLTIFQLTWAMVNPEAGSITGSGFFSSSLTPGLYPDAIRLSLLLPGLSTLEPAAEALVDVEITGVPATVIIKGIPDEMAPGDTVFLRSIILDAKGERVPGATVVWDIVDERAGRISSLGLFTAGSTNGLFDGSIRVRVLAP